MKKQHAGIIRSSLALATCLALAGCTVAPRPVHDSESSFDGNAQNSGFVGYDAAGNAILTPSARDRYNLLVARYGTNYAPALVFDAGVTRTETNTYLMDRQHWVDAQEMNLRRKSGR